jgi:hypothetical protein
MIRKCKECGFILGTKPGLLEVDGVCQACINKKNTEAFDLEFSQKTLKEICESAKAKKGVYDCVVGVSGGKDSTVIVGALVEEYGMKPLLVTITDEFTHTKAGVLSMKNISKRFNLDHIVFRCEPQTFIEETKKDFFNELHPLKWIEERCYSMTTKIAKAYGIRDVFFGENSAFQYGLSPKLEMLHPLSDKDTNVIFFFALFPYSETGNRIKAKEYGFVDLDDTGEWFRQGHIENYTQQDSIAYIIQFYTKFLKFGFQRVSDIACRFVRDGLLTKEQAEEYIADRDWVCDPFAKRDFCNTLGITEKEFDETCDRFANTDLLVKDKNGAWRRKDYYKGAL